MLSTDKGTHKTRVDSWGDEGRDTKVNTHAQEDSAESRDPANHGGSSAHKNTANEP